MLIAIARRMLLSLLTLLMLAAFVFVATEIMPGDALDVSLSADELAMIPPERLAQIPSSLIFLRIRPELGDDRIPAEVAVGVASEVTEQLPGFRAGDRSRGIGSGFIFERARSEKIDPNHGGPFDSKGSPGELAGGDDQRIPPTGPPPDEGIGWQGALPCQPVSRHFIQYVRYNGFIGIGEIRGKIGSSLKKFF